MFRLPCFPAARRRPAEALQHRQKSNKVAPITPRGSLSPELRDALHGPADWSEFIEPLHPRLRSEIVKYGELAQATYDSFDGDSWSKYKGFCRYSLADFFPRVGLSGCGYAVTTFLYATCDARLPEWYEKAIHDEAPESDANWMGYVAVSDAGETARIGFRDIVVAWRGTQTPEEWVKDFQASYVPIDAGEGRQPMVEKGFHSLFTASSETSLYAHRSAKQQVRDELRRLVTFFRELGEQVCITVTGHSLGAALAVLAGYDAAGEFPDVPVTVVTFAGPRVGDEAFRRSLMEDRKVKVLRVVSKQDVVPKVPGIAADLDNLLDNAGEIGMLAKMKAVRDWTVHLALRLLHPYVHVGTELRLDVTSSRFLKQGAGDLAGFHNLEVYLHLVDGYEGHGEAFRAGAKRDPALVNKTSKMLAPDRMVPEFWYQPENKGMAKDAQGRWRPDAAADGFPSPDATVALAQLLAR